MRHFTWVILSLLIISGLAPAAEDESQSKKITIPELTAMHEAIYPLWHKAYPEKDVQLLQALYPDLEEHFRKLRDSKFPEQWPDRKMHWQEGLNTMKNALKSYKNAVDTNHQENLLSSAEKVHSAYEQLVKVVNPPIPEVDAFHEVLYYVYHHYLPNQNWEKIDESIAQFSERMSSLNQAELPKWMYDKQAAFDSARQNLAVMVDELAKLKGTDEHQQIQSAVLNLHDAYEKMEEVLK